MFMILIFPLVLLVPDLILKVTPKVFWPNPIDKVMLEYKKKVAEHQINLIHAVDKDGIQPINSVDNSAIDNAISKETVI